MEYKFQNINNNTLKSLNNRYSGNWNLYAIRRGSLFRRETYKYIGVNKSKYIAMKECP